MPGQVHALVRLELAAVVHHRFHPAVTHAGHLHREQPVVEQDPRADPHVLGKPVVGGGDLAGSGIALGREDHALPGLEPQRLLQGADPDARPLQVQQNRGRLGAALA